MSLLDEAMETFCMIDKVTVSDGEGGYIAQWQEGAEFTAAARLDNSLQARTAKAAGVKDLYTITTRKNVTLDFHDVVKRVSDGQVFRVTSNGNDQKTPDSAYLNMRQVSAESWVLPS